MLTAIEYVEPAVDQSQAQRWLDGHRSQCDFLGGRILPPANQTGKTHFRLQSFFNAGGITMQDKLPDNCRLVLVPPAIEALLEFPERRTCR